MQHSKTGSLGKSERLKSRKQIDSLFESGKKINVFPFRILYHTESRENGLQAGFTVSSRTFPRAVDRNRIKRLTRESYRLQKTPLELLVQENKIRLQLFLIYTGREILSYEEVFSKMKAVLDKLIRTLHETIAPDS